MFQSIVKRVVSKPQTSRPYQTNSSDGFTSLSYVPKSLLAKLNNKKKINEATETKTKTSTGWKSLRSNLSKLNQLANKSGNKKGPTSQSKWSVIQHALSGSNSASPLSNVLQALQAVEVRVKMLKNVKKLKRSPCFG